MLWGALNNATQGMMATSWSMGSISQNIANVNTVGYKNKETLFKTLMSESKAAPMAGSSGLNVFTVKAADRYHIQNQGVITPTHQWSDMAINGRGFFMVAQPTATGAAPTSPNTGNANDVVYTRAGTFHQVAGDGGRNYMVTESGHYLLGWQADATGVVNKGSLSPVYTLPQTVMEGEPTTTARLIANLPSNAPMGPSSYTSSDIAVTDGLGAPVNMQLQWARVDGDTWTATPFFPGGEGVVTSAPITVTRDAWGNSTVVTPVLPTNVDITWNLGHYDNTDAATTLATQPGTHALAGLSGAPSTPHLERINLPVYDSDGNAQTVALSFERASANKWYMHVAGATSEPVEINFTGDGQLIGPQSSAVAMTFTQGTPPVTTTADVTIDLSQMEQYNSSGIYIREVDQNGFPDGLLRYSRFNAVGELEGTYDNGETRILFQVPVATFTSENSLEAISGTMFRRSEGAGELTVSGIDSTADGGGYITSGAIENSTVKIEDEFTRMIMTQKAYSTNATVFKTADEMTTTVRDLK